MMLGSFQFLSPLNVALFGAVAISFLVGFGVLRLLGGPPTAMSRHWGLIGIRTAAVVTLLVILLNPSNVTRMPGPIDRSDMFYLLDTSQSMAVGDNESRFEHATRLMREADQATRDDTHAVVKLFRFGHRLVAVENAELDLRDENQEFKKKPNEIHEERGGRASSITPVAVAAQSTSTLADSKAKQPRLAPTDSDTQLLGALRQVPSRFGRRRPAGIVLFSDGRAHDESGVEQLATQFAKLNVPVHVVPVGDTANGGDVAIVACVVPPRARRLAEVEVQVFLRSYGYDGRRCEVSLIAPSKADDEVDRSLAPPVPVTLHDGFQSVGLSFRTDTKTRKIQVNVSPFPDEASTANNSFNAEVHIDRTKIRLLYVEGSTQPTQRVQTGNQFELHAPYSDLHKALTEDEDIECVVLQALPNAPGRLFRVAEAAGAVTGRGFPESIAELSAFDAIILSNVAANAFTEQQLLWLDKWIGQRGGGLLMVGGQRSFSSGHWDETRLAEMLPIEMRSDDDWLPSTQVSVVAEQQSMSHPLWTIVSDERQNRDIVGQFPSFYGINRWAGVKPNLTRVLGMSNLAASDAPTGNVAPISESEMPPKMKSETKSRLKQGAGASDSPETVDADGSKQPAIVVGQYGRGRTMVMAMPITRPWANDFLNKWGSDTKYVGKFWRNAIYWLTENSSIGRRRLIVTADKKFYRPGETISLTAVAFDESTNQTGSYKITAMIEPKSSLNELDINYSPIRWPDGKPRDSTESSPFIAWGEEFDLPRTDTTGGKPAFSIELPVADALTVGSASQSLHIELTAMEEFTQVDSTSLNVQILHDPFEQQNPFPNHEL